MLPFQTMGRPAKTLPIGERFGRLIILEQVHNLHDTSYRCRCDCGKETIARALDIRRGVISSCGCLGRERRLASVTKHGFTSSSRQNWHPLYARWLSMKSRCFNENFRSYQDYGARGITVCDRWRDSFEAFLQDVGAPPDDGQRWTLERKDNEGNYEPDNVIWALPKAQMRNKRSNVTITFEGETRCLSEWAEITGIGVSTISYRVRAGWTPEEVLTKK